MDRVSDVGTLDKCVLVLDAVEAGPASLGELVARTGLHRATAHRLAVALEAHRLVRRDGEGRFAPGPRLIGLGRAALAAFPVADVAGPALGGLRDATGESAQLYVRDGEARVCVAAIESPRGLRTIVPVGAVLPIDRGSAGKVLVDDPPEWAESVEEREPGVASVSAPVRDVAGAVVAAVSVSGPIDRTTRSPGARYASAVCTAARTVEAAIAR